MQDEETGWTAQLFPFHYSLIVWKPPRDDGHTIRGPTLQSARIEYSCSLELSPQLSDTFAAQLQILRGREWWRIRQ